MTETATDWREITPAEAAALEPYVLRAADLSDYGKAYLSEAERALTLALMRAHGLGLRRTEPTQQDHTAIARDLVAFLNKHLIPLLPRERTQ